MKQFKHLIKPYIIWASILIVVPLILIVLYAFTSDGNEVLTLHFTWANFAKFLEAVYHLGFDPDRGTIDPDRALCIYLRWK